MFIKGCDQIKSETGATVLVVHHSGKNPERGARGSSALRAALDTEICVQRESSRSLIVTFTKMKDAEQPEGTAYELECIHLLTDSDGDIITSLTVIDSGREPEEPEPSKPPMTKNHQAVWQAVRSRTASGEEVIYPVVRDDLKSQGMNIKHCSRWVKDLVGRNQLLRNGDVLSMPANTSAA